MVSGATGGFNLGTAVLYITTDTRDLETGIRSARASISNGLERVSRDARLAGLTITAAISAPIVGIGVLSGRAALEFGANMADILKYVNTTSDGTAQLTQQIRDLAKVLPTTLGDISKIASTGAQYGLPSNQIAEFTQVAVDLGNASDISAEKGIEGLTRLTAIMGPAAGGVRGLADAFVSLKDVGQATGTQTLDLSTRIAGVGKTLGLTSQDVIGISNGVASVIPQTELAASTLTRVFEEMAKAAAGAKTIKPFSEIVTAGDIKAFQDLVKTDPAEAVLRFVTALDKLDKSGGDVFGTLKALNLDTIRSVPTLLTIAGANDTLRESIDRVNDSTKTAGATAATADKVYETDAAKLQLYQNQLNDVAITVGAQLIPVFKEFVANLTVLAQGFASLPEFPRGLIIGALAFGAALGPIVFALGSLGAIASPTYRFISGIVNYFKALGTGASDASIRVNGLGRSLQDVTGRNAAGQTPLIDINNPIAPITAVRPQVDRVALNAQISAISRQSDARILAIRQATQRESQAIAQKASIDARNSLAESTRIRQDAAQRVLSLKQSTSQEAQALAQSAALEAQASPLVGPLIRQDAARRILDMRRATQREAQAITQEAAREATSAASSAPAIRQQAQRDILSLRQSSQQQILEMRQQTAAQVNQVRLDAQQLAEARAASATSGVSTIPAANVAATASEEAATRAVLARAEAERLWAVAAQSKLDLNTALASGNATEAATEELAAKAESDTVNARRASIVAIEAETAAKEEATVATSAFTLASAGSVLGFVGIAAAIAATIYGFVSYKKAVDDAAASQEHLNNVQNLVRHQTLGDLNSQLAEQTRQIDETQKRIDQLNLEKLNAPVLGGATGFPVVQFDKQKELDDAVDKLGKLKSNAADTQAAINQLSDSAFSAGSAITGMQADISADPGESATAWIARVRTQIQGVTEDAAKATIATEYLKKKQEIANQVPNAIAALASVSDNPEALPSPEDIAKSLPKPPTDEELQSQARKAYNDFFDNLINQKKAEADLFGGQDARDKKAQLDALNDSITGTVKKGPADKAIDERAKALVEAAFQDLPGLSAAQQQIASISSSNQSNVDKVNQAFQVLDHLWTTEAIPALQRLGQVTDDTYRDEFDNAVRNAQDTQKFLDARKTAFAEANIRDLPGIKALQQQLQGIDAGGGSNVSKLAQQYKLLDDYWANTAIPLLKAAGIAITDTTRDTYEAIAKEITDGKNKVQDAANGISGLLAGLVTREIAIGLSPGAGRVRFNSDFAAAQQNNFTQNIGQVNVGVRPDVPGGIDAPKILPVLKESFAGSQTPSPNRRW